MDFVPLKGAPSGRSLAHVLNHLSLRSTTVPKWRAPTEDSGLASHSAGLMDLCASKERMMLDAPFPEALGRVSAVKMEFYAIFTIATLK